MLIKTRLRKSLYSLEELETNIHFKNITLSIRVWNSIFSLKVLIASFENK